ncbi:thiolase family protein [Phenylobacterium sp. LH3H17]|uniref:thiolase family protein n=1 Tax=Phenylobacterium sp. LH3H17 TaxID=2903901 RepID=UPI0020C9501D|nr:thiolase family protein [Phenylobacterium sp. LH3H17]UTP38289.1 thiolase family protein [Phenylobacterium sp. LH3H17]
MARETAAVIGVGQTPYRIHHADKTYVELAQAAAKIALDDAGMTPDDIDAIVFSMAPTEFMGVNDVDRWANAHVWGADKPFMRINTGGATGGSAAQAACDFICSGVYDTVLVVGADRVAETPDAQHILNLIWDPFYEQDFALNTITMTALAAQRYMARYGVSEEQFARVAVRARRNAVGNAYAHLKGEISIEDVMTSRRIAWPFKKFDICPRSSGAAAVVMTNKKIAARQCARPAFVTGRSAISHTVFMGDRLGLWSDTEFADHDGFWMAGQAAYRQAGVIDPWREIQVVELYDPFSSFQFPQLEALRFCAAGRAAAISDAGGLDLQGGGVAVNPSGGTLCTNPIGVTGLVRFIEAAAQVMGRAGDNQVSGVHRALATAIGGSTQFFTCTVLSDDA